MSDSKKGNCHKFIKAGLILGGIFTVAFLAAKKYAETDSMDQENPYLKTGDGNEHEKIMSCSKATFYEKYVKPGLDKILSFTGLVLLTPVYAVISIAICLDDPGSILFTQKRVGKDGHFFELHKFRTMKMDTPHDVPTHQLTDPDQYITRVGGFLRKYSLDELPQVWDIFRGKMSIIGPRPALWNQEDLIAERKKYDANSVMPGLTGWAQINGRDELEITDKAALDGEYVRRLRSGNLKGLFFDLKCFFGTVKSVAGSEGVVEGGTGTLQQDEAAGEPNCSEPEARKQKKNSRVWKLKRTHGKKDVIPPVDPADAGFEDYGYKKEFHIDKNIAKKVLITGAGSYVGESFQNYATEHYPNLTVDTVDMVDGSWRERDFSGYDSVFHVAGIAHADTGKVTEEEKKKYYEVNTDLAIETAKKCKTEGVKQFILMSSMIVYGESAPYGKKKVINEHTVPAPANFYGDSKWQADQGVRKLQDDGFRVAVIRAPMIYGKGSKGIYPLLAKLAKRLPVFPDVETERSMLYIGNLCEFVSLLVMSGEGGVYFPQNEKYGKTSELVRLIGEASDHKVRLEKWMRPLAAVAGRMPGKIGRLAGKAFGNNIYGQMLSQYNDLNYIKYITLKSTVYAGLDQG